MSQKPADPVEEPVEDEDSDEYDDVEDVEEEDGVEYEDDEDEDDDDGARPSGRQGSLTALLLGEGDAADDGEEEEEEDEEYTEEPAKNGISPSATVSGTKRGREEDDVGDDGLEGDYGEFEDNSKVGTKRAKTSGEKA
ncbi:hypothetical protein BKA93DRAFT_823164 [Sparassis latifolia]